MLTARVQIGWIEIRRMRTPCEEMVDLQAGGWEGRQGCALRLSQQIRDFDLRAFPKHCASEARDIMEGAPS